MSLITKIDAKLNKSKYYRVIRFKQDRLIDIDYVRKTDSNIIKDADTESAYTIDNNNVFYLNGYVTIFYSNDRPFSFNPLALDNGDVNSKELYDAIEQTVSRDIIRQINDDGKELKTIMLMVLAVLAGLAIGFYLTNGWVVELQSQITELQSTVDSLSDIMIR